MAGQNMIRLWEPELLESQRRWMAEATRNGRQLVVEPWLERVVDFSIQLEMEPVGLKLCGFTGLINDHRGQFQANYAEAHCARRLPAKVTELFRGPGNVASRLPAFYDEVMAMLDGELQRAGHRGPAGIDAFVFRTAEGGVRLKPVVEINPRYTMGRLTLPCLRDT